MPLIIGGTRALNLTRMMQRIEPNREALREREFPVSSIVL